MRWLIALSLIFNFFLAGCGSDSTATKPNDFTPLTQIIISSENPSIADKTTNQFTAIGNFSNIFTSDITTEVAWTSSDTDVAIINNNGLARAVAPGITQITATLDGVFDFFILEVTDTQIRRIDVTPNAPTVSKGLTQQFEAIGTFSDASVQNLTDAAIWTSVNTDIVEIDGKGLATALLVGTSNITAAFDGTTKTTQMTVVDAALVSIDVTPISAVDAPQGLNVKFTATGTFTDGSRSNISGQVNWNSSNTSIVTVDNLGNAVGVSQGTATITASIDSLSDSSTMSVSGEELVEINVTADTQTIETGGTANFTATGLLTNNASIDITENVIWSSSQPDIATVSNNIGEEGVATGVSPGDTIVRATSGVLEDPLSLTVN